MHRRSFIVRFFAVIAAFFAGFAPKKVNAAPVAYKQQHATYKQRLFVFKDLDAMIEAICDYTRTHDHRILVADDPQSLRLGYAADTPDPIVWQVPLTSVKALPEGSDLRVRVIRWNLKTLSRRQKLAEALSNGHFKWWKLERPTS